MILRQANRRPAVRRGDLVTVRSEEQIRTTLDADGKTDGLPFMPEMLEYCGRPMRVYRRADRVLLDNRWYVGRLRHTVLLEAARCDGHAHGGCQMACLLLWNEAWLAPAGTPADTHTANAQDGSHHLPTLPTERDGRFCCQATALVDATTPLPWWDVQQYVRDLVSGNLGAAELARILGLAALNKLLSRLGCRRLGTLQGKATDGCDGHLDLKPGEWAEVKSREEIAATLDSEQRNRGLGFTPEMAQYCGRRYRVARRVGKIVIEWTGEIRPLRDTVALEGVACQGTYARGCPRACYHLWREAWLRRVE